MPVALSVHPPNRARKGAGKLGIAPPKVRNCSHCPVVKQHAGHGPLPVPSPVVGAGLIRVPRGAMKTKLHHVDKSAVMAVTSSGKKCGNCLVRGVRKKVWLVSHAGTWGSDSACQRGLICGWCG
jgi:hypothetical protein